MQAQVEQFFGNAASAETAVTVALRVCRDVRTQGFLKLACADRL
jgi:hypothetical protein